jgi:transcriptional regulator with XRE-family HTH domain
MSLDQAAEKLGTTKQALSRIERGMRTTERETLLRRIAKLTNYEVTPNDMLLADEERV